MSHYTESFNRLVMNTRTNKKEPLGSFFIGRIDMILMCSILIPKQGNCFGGRLRPHRFARIKGEKGVIYTLLTSSVFCLQHLRHFFRGLLAAACKPQFNNGIKSVSEKFNMIFNVTVYMLFFCSFGIIY